MYYYHIGELQTSMSPIEPNIRLFLMLQLEVRSEMYQQDGNTDKFQKERVRDLNPVTEHVSHHK